MIKILKAALIVSLNSSISLAIASPPVKSKAETVSELNIRKIQSQMKAPENLKVQFNQTIYRSLRNRSTKSQGVAYFSKPNRFRWILKEPKKVEWVFDGTDLFNYFPEKKLAVKHDSKVSKGRELRQLVNMVINFDELLKTFIIASANQTEDKITINLEPKGRGDISSAQLVLLKKTGFFDSIRLNFWKKNYTQFNFSKPETGPIAANVYKLPTGTKTTNPLAP